MKRLTVDPAEDEVIFGPARADQETLAGLSPTMITQRRNEKPNE